jgi:hypothetical protein
MDAAKGVSITGLLGKTSKGASGPPGFVVAPQVTQVQQILSVNIIFVKKTDFPLGVFAPLGLEIVRYYLRDHSKAEVRGDRSTYARQCRDCIFFIVELRYDGGEIGSLTSSLQASCIVVSIAGSANTRPWSSAWRERRKVDIDATSWRYRVLNSYHRRVV